MKSKSSNFLQKDDRIETHIKIDEWVHFQIKGTAGTVIYSTHSYSGKIIVLGKHDHLIRCTL